MRQAIASLKGLLEAGAVLTAIFSVATAFDGLHQYLELFSHFRLQYLVVAAWLAVFFAVIRSRRHLLLMLAVAALNTWFVAPWYQSDEIAAGHEAGFKVLLANVLTTNGEHEKLSALLAEERPDFVFLQEVSDGWAARIDQIEEYPYRHVVPRSGSFGIAMLSRFPIDRAETILSPPRDFPTIVAIVSVQGETITFTSTHPMPPLGNANYDARNKQLADVAQIVNGQDTARVLIGDLNTTMWGNNYRGLIENTGLRNARQGFGLLPTWPTHIPIAKIPIDHCLISDELAVIDIHTGPTIGSDHLPLIVTLSTTGPSS